MNLKTFLFEEWEADAPAEAIDYALLAKALYADVRALPYNVRHALMDRFPNPRLFDSGSSSFTAFRSGPRNLSEEQIANILFNLFCRFLNRVAWSYQSGGAKPRAFHVPTEGTTPGSAFVYDARTRTVIGCSTQYGQPVYYAECSTLARGLADVFVAFGFPPSRVGTVFCEPDVAHGRMATRRPEEIRASRSIYGVDLTCAMTSPSIYDPLSRTGCDSYHADDRVFTPLFMERVEDEIVPGLKARRRAMGTGMALTATQLGEVAKRMRARTGNVLNLEDNSKFHATSRDVFVNHFCTFLLPARDGRPYVAPYFDPLYQLRYANGLPDLYEQYNPAGEYPIDDLLAADRGRRENNTAVLYRAQECPRRLMIRIPETVDPLIQRTWYPYKYMDEEAPDYETFQHLEFEYQRGEEFDWLKRLDYLELLRAKHGELYLFVDEDDATFTASGMPSEILQLRTMASEASFLAQLKAYRERRRPLLRRGSETRGELRRASVGADAPARPRASSMSLGRARR